jgi:hypothetical protein
MFAALHTQGALMIARLHKPTLRSVPSVALFSSETATSNFDAQFAALFERATGEHFILPGAQADRFAKSGTVAFLEQDHDNGHAQFIPGNVPVDDFSFQSTSGEFVFRQETQGVANHGIFAASSWSFQTDPFFGGGLVQFLGVLNNDAASVAAWRDIFVPQLEALFATRAKFDGVSAADEVARVHDFDAPAFNHEFVHEGNTVGQSTTGMPKGMSFEAFFEVFSFE